MLNLDADLEKLKDLEEISKRALGNARLSIQEMEGSEVVVSFIDRATECFKSGNGFDELKKNIENYAGNR